jgi:ketosteroid isomerase-like protein
MRKLHRWLLAFLLARSFTGALQSSVAFAATAEEEVDRLEDDRYAAMMYGDVTRLGRILADEFVYHQPTGRTATKASYIEQLRSGDLKIHEARRYDVTIRVYGNTATGMGLTHLDVEQKGERRQLELRYLNVWVLRDGRWQLAARQSAFMPK